MNHKKLLLISFLCSIIPLLFGSILFFIWHINRVFYLRYVDIELLSFFAIISFALFGLISLLISIYIFFRNKEDRLYSIINLLLLFITVLLIIIYGSNYDTYQKVATIKIKNESGYPICNLRLYGSYFEESKRECIENGKHSLYDIIPLRVYSWKLVGDSFKHYPFTYEKVKIDISFFRTKKTFQLSEIQEGEYIELVIQKNMKLSFRKTHRKLHFL